MPARRFPARVTMTMTLVLGAVLGLAGAGPATAAPAVPATQAARAAQDTAAAAPATQRQGLGGRIDKLVERQLREYDIPGASVVVVSGDRQLMARGYGRADADRAEPVRADGTGFFMGSVAKMFTATAVLQLVEQGKLELDADVNDYLKRFRIADSYPGKPVTAAHLLTHTAGFDNSIIGRASADPEGNESLADSLAEHQPDRIRAPGKVASYDNYGGALAGLLVEEISGEPFERYVAEHILKPLGMTRTSFEQPYPKQGEVRLARGHRPEGDGQTTAKGQYGAWTPTGAGAVTTATDMGRLLSSQLRDGAAGKGTRVLSAKSSELMRERHFGNDSRLPGMAYVLEERARSGHRFLAKDGDVPGFHSNMALLPDENLGVFVSYNGDGRDNLAFHAGKELVDEIADQVYGDGGAGGAKPRASADREDAGRYEGEYRSTRTSHSDLTRAAALTGSVEVTAHGDGTLTTTGPLSHDPDVTEQRWTPVAPGVFQEQDGQDRIAFRGGRLSIGSDPSVAYERLPWHESPALHQLLLIGGLVLVLGSLLGWAVTALVRTVRRSPAAPRGARLARLLACVTGLLLTAATMGFIALVADGNALNEAVVTGDSPLLTAVPVLLVAAVLTTAAVLVCAVLAWFRRWWGWAARLHYSGTALSAALVLVLAGQYQLLY